MFNVLPSNLIHYTNKVFLIFQTNICIPIIKYNVIIYYNAFHYCIFNYLEFVEH